MTVLYFIGYFLLFVFLFWKYSKTKPPVIGSLFMPTLFVFKVICGMLAYEIHYSFYGGGDIAVFYTTSVVLKEALFSTDLPTFIDIFLARNLEDSTVFSYAQRLAYWDADGFWILPVDNRFISRILLLLNLLSGGNYFAMMCFISAISLAALNGYYRFFLWIYPKGKQEALWAAYLVPSVLFWSSAVLKEAFAISAIGFSLYFIIALKERIKVSAVLGLIAALTSLVTVKTYLLLSLIAPLLFLLVTNNTQPKKRLLGSASIIMGLFGLAIVISSFLPEKFNFLYQIHQKLLDFTSISKGIANSFFSIPTNENWWEFALYVPLANLNVWWQPQVFLQATTYVYYLQIIELLLIWGLSFLGLFALKNSLITVDARALRILLFCFMAVFILGTLIGTTVPVHGAVSRYKSPFMPFFIYSMLYFALPAINHRFGKINVEKHK
ncbi:MAG: hypothetical protein ACXITV_06635 [Luteibaculaceae bacterium]